MSVEEYGHRALPYEIRYNTSVPLADAAPWVPCVKASIDDGVLAIDHGSHIEWVPTHRIHVAEYRRRKFSSGSGWCAPAAVIYEAA